jgi:hypothetical protein
MTQPSKYIWIDGELNCPALWEYRYEGKSGSIAFAQIRHPICLTPDDNDPEILKAEADGQSVCRKFAEWVRENKKRDITFREITNLEPLGAFAYSPENGKYYRTLWTKIVQVFN